MQQTRIRAATLQQTIRLYPLLDRANLDRTFDPWWRTVGNVVKAGRTRSMRAGASYYAQFRQAEGAKDTFAPKTAGELMEDRIRANLARALRLGIDFADYNPAMAELAEQRILTDVLGAVGTMTLDGGRETIVNSAVEDKAMAGVARAAGPDCCAFCAMLASRGPVYKEETAGFQAHDHCACEPEPVSAEGEYEWPDNSAAYADAWSQSDGTLNGFRRELYDRADNTALNAARREQYAATKQASSTAG